MTIIKEPMYHFRISGDEQVASHREWTAKVERPDMAELAERMVEVIRDGSPWGMQSPATPTMRSIIRWISARNSSASARSSSVTAGSANEASVGGLRVALGALVRLDELSQVITCPAGD